jgi:hypothetical protein
VGGARPLRAGRQRVMRRGSRQDRIPVPVKIGNPIGSDSPAYVALTAADEDIQSKGGNA